MENFNRFFENFLRGPVTTAAGLVGMGWVGWAWFFEYLSDAQAITLGLIAAVFFFIKDEIPGFLRTIIGGAFAYIKKKLGIE